MLRFNLISYLSKQHVLKLIDKKLRRLRSTLAGLKRPVLSQSTLNFGSSNHSQSSTPITPSTNNIASSSKTVQYAQSQPPRTHQSDPSPLTSISSYPSAQFSALQAGKSMSGKSVASSVERCPACNNVWHPLKECPLVKADG